MGDLVEVGEDERLEIREDQVQMVKFQDKKEGSRRYEGHNGIFPHAGSNCGPSPIKMKGDPDVGITEAPVLKAKESNKIRDIARGFAKFQKNRATLG